jgi:hypothetical protein
MAHDVFISYSSKDKKVADAVCVKLESQKIRCWIAPRDVPPGQSWAGVIVEALSKSKVFVLVFSDGSNKSNQVIREVGEAVDNGIPIVPLRIEDVEPSQEMRYYIKSIHWLDAMTPPLEAHLQRLTNSDRALLSAEAGEIPSEAALPVVEAPVQKRWPMPIWATALIALAAVVIVGGGIWALTKNGSGTPSMTPTSMVSPTEDSSAADVSSPTEAAPTGEIVEEPTAVSAASEEVDGWRPLDFMIPNPRLWDTTIDDRYVALGPSDWDAFAWSTEIFEGDLMVSLDLQRPESQSDGCVIVYGGGIEFSYGSLIFCVSWDGFMLEKHTKYHEGENFLAFSPRDNETDEVFSVTIEIIDDIASMYLGSEKVLSTIFDQEEIEGWGRIGLWKNWTIGDVIFTNIKVKTPGEVDQEPSTSAVVEFDCELDTGSQANYYPVKSPYISHSVEIDGEITSAEEWSNAPCIDFRLHYGINVTNPNFQRARWWVQNNGQDIFFLFRVPKEYEARGVFVDYWWPEYTGTWEHSDGVYVKTNGENRDLGQWDEMQWQEDKDLDPPGTVDVEARSTEDDAFYWFEIKRALSSGDRYDWIFEPGYKYGANPYDSVMVGMESEEGTFLRYIQLEVGEP